MRRWCGSRPAQAIGIARVRRSTSPMPRIAPVSSTVLVDCGWGIDGDVLPLAKLQGWK